MDDQQLRPVVVYVDGACVPCPGVAASAALVIDRYVAKETAAVVGWGNTLLAELTAIDIALDGLFDITAPTIIYSDSQQSISSIYGHCRVGRQGRLVERVRRRVAEFRDLVIHKVKGHSGNELHNRCDQLARQCARNHVGGYRPAVLFRTDVVPQWVECPPYVAEMAKKLQFQLTADDWSRWMDERRSQRNGEVDATMRQK